MTDNLFKPILAGVLCILLGIYIGYTWKEISATESPTAQSPPRLTIRLDQMNETRFVVQVFNRDGVMSDFFFEKLGFRKFLPFVARETFDDVDIWMEASKYKPYEIPITRDSSTMNYQAQIDELWKTVYAKGKSK